MIFSLIAPSVSPQSGAGQPNTQAPLGLTLFCVYCAAISADVCARPARSVRGAIRDMAWVTRLKSDSRSRADKHRSIPSGDCEPGAPACQTSGIKNARIDLEKVV